MLGVLTIWTLENTPLGAICSATCDKFHLFLNHPLWRVWVWVQVWRTSQSKSIKLTFPSVSSSSLEANCFPYTHTHTHTHTPLPLLPHLNLFLLQSSLHSSHNPPDSSLTPLSSSLLPWSLKLFRPIPLPPKWVMVNRMLWLSVQINRKKHSSGQKKKKAGSLLNARFKPSKGLM